jgi:DNA-binding transcriptional MerR regulator
MASQHQQVRTVAEIALRTGRSVRQIEYVTRSRAIRPFGRLYGSHTRVFTADDIERIRQVLRQIAVRGIGGAK